MNENGKEPGNIKDIKLRISGEHAVENTSGTSRRFVVETGTDVDMEKVTDKLKHIIPELREHEFSVHIDPGVLALQHK